MCIDVQHTHLGEVPTANNNKTKIQTKHPSSVKITSIKCL